MKQTLLLIALLIAFSVRAQITISNTDMPKGGNIYLFSNGDITKIMPSDLQQTGANQTWNFNLVSTSQVFDTAYKMSQVPIIFYATFFSSDYADKLAPDIKLGIISFTNNFSFFNLTSSKLEQTGTGSYLTGIPFPTFYKPTDVIYRFPMDYSKSDSSTSHFSATVPTIGSWKEGKKRVNEIDGWGTLKTPFGDKDVLRVHSDVYYNDTITVDTVLHISFPYSHHQVEYKWLAKNGGFPCCR